MTHVSSPPFMFVLLGTALAPGPAPVAVSTVDTPVSLRGARGITDAPFALTVSACPHSVCLPRGRTCRSPAAGGPTLRQATHTRTRQAAGLGAVRSPVHLGAGHSGRHGRDGWAWYAILHSSPPAPPKGQIVAPPPPPVCHPPPHCVGQGRS